MVCNVVLVQSASLCCPPAHLGSVSDQVLWIAMTTVVGDVEGVLLCVCVASTESYCSSELPIRLQTHRNIYKQLSVTLSFLNTLKYDMKNAMVHVGGIFGIKKLLLMELQDEHTPATAFCTVTLDLHVWFHRWNDVAAHQITLHTNPKYDQHLLHHWVVLTMCRNQQWCCHSLSVITGGPVSAGRVAHMHKHEDLTALIRGFATFLHANAFILNLGRVAHGAIGLHLLWLSSQNIYCHDLLQTYRPPQSLCKVFFEILYPPRNTPWSKAICRLMSQIQCSTSTKCWSPEDECTIHESAWIWDILKGAVHITHAQHFGLFCGWSCPDLMNPSSLLGACWKLDHCAAFYVGNSLPRRVCMNSMCQRPKYLPYSKCSL